ILLQLLSHGTVVWLAVGLLWRSEPVLVGVYRGLHLSIGILFHRFRRATVLEFRAFITWRGGPRQARHPNVRIVSPSRRGRRTSGLRHRVTWVLFIGRSLKPWTLHAKHSHLGVLLRVPGAATNIYL